MKILVLGASGYLGQEIVHFFYKNYDLKVCSRNSAPFKNILNNKNIIETKNYSFKDLCIALRDVNVVIHLVGINKKNSEKLKNKSINFKKKVTRNILKACSYVGVSKLIYVSSIQVYKNYLKKKKITENSKLTNCKNNYYALSHIEAENLIKNYKKINFLILRVSNVYGFQKYRNSKELNNTVVNNICINAFKNKNILIDNPNLIRNFLPLKFFLIKLRNLLTSTVTCNKVYNVGYLTLNLYKLSKLIKFQYFHIFNKEIYIKFNKLYKKQNNFFLYCSNFLNYKCNIDLMSKEIKNIFISLKKLK